ncbi:MAG: NUDIX domain-containing protein [Thermosipho sp. (in: Bacteria)]|nr:NUDIX domain-containing protein [Thermosipho sp. (in: thermotogales)]
MFSSFIENIRRSNKQKVAVISYIVNEFNEVLFLKRTKEPFKNKLVPPGGKIEKNESPSQAMKREIFEETGLKISDNYVLKVITTEIGPENYNWILFIYKAFVKKQPLVSSPEGELYWIKKEGLYLSELSEIDKKILPFIFDKKGLYLLYINYDVRKNAEVLKVKILSTFFQ